MLTKIKKNKVRRKGGHFDLKEALNCKDQLKKHIGKQKKTNIKKNLKGEPWNYLEGEVSPILFQKYSGPHFEVLL